jgi:hypothetical protein
MASKLARLECSTVVPSVGRLTAIIAVALAMTTLKNWDNYHQYWNQTIFATQTVDFNLLSHTLPSKLSSSLIQGDTEELQRTLESNYGLFGLVVTDCLTEATDCPNQKILYTSQSSRHQKVKFALADLSRCPYDLLRDPPPLFVEQQYPSPYSWRPNATGKTNRGKIIGRVYYIRRVPPTFVEDYGDWLRNLFKLRGSGRVYSLTAALFITGGFTSWIIIELVFCSKRQQQKQLQQNAQRLKQQLEEKKQQISLLITQREQSLAELESYQAEQQQYTQELEEAIAFYSSQLTALQQQQEISQNLSSLANQLTDVTEIQSLVPNLDVLAEKEINSLEKHLNPQEQDRQQILQILELLQQDLSDTQQRVADANSEMEKLNLTINKLNNERDRSQQKIRHLKQQLAKFPDIKQLQTALDNAQKAEVLAFEEVKKLEVENQKLENEKWKLVGDLEYAKKRIYYLEQESYQHKHFGQADNLSNFVLVFSSQAREEILSLCKIDNKKYTQITKTLELMTTNLRHPSLNTHKYNAMSGLNKEQMFESYAADGWRIFWHYGPGEKFLTIHAISPHP